MATLVAGLFYFAAIQIEKRNSVSLASSALDAVLAEVSNSIKAQVESSGQQLAASLSEPVFRARLSSFMRSQVLPGIGDKNRGSRLKQANAYLASIKTPLFVSHNRIQFLNLNGQVLFDSQKPKQFGQNSNLFLGQDRKFFLILIETSADGDQILKVSMPIQVAGQNIGSMIVLDPFDLSAYERRTQSKIVIGDQRETELNNKNMVSRSTSISFAEIERTVLRVQIFQDLEARIQPFVSAATQFLILFLVAIGILSLFIAIWFSKSLSQPLIEFQQMVDRVRFGDLNSVAPRAKIRELDSLSLALNEMTQSLRLNEKLRNTFQRYLPSQVINKVMEDPSLLELGGSLKDLTIVFVDISGFTAFSEMLAPNEVLGKLNEFFEVVTRELVSEGATLAQYTGDGLLCFFGAPLEQGDHAGRAIRACVNAERAGTQVLRQISREGNGELGVRIGIHSGKTLVGNIGSRFRQDYTVIGDIVNIASRLEGANKIYGTRIIASLETQELSNLAEPQFRKLDRLRMRGKVQAIDIVEVVPAEQKFSPEQLGIFDSAIECYIDQKWPESEALFSDFLKLCPKDSAGQMFLSRVQKFKVTPPNIYWDGSLDLDERRGR